MERKEGSRNSPCGRISRGGGSCIAGGSPESPCGNIVGAEIRTTAIYPKLAIYPIRYVERVTGLTGRRIRYYESLGLIKPLRTSGNQRLYSEEDVKLLVKIKSLFEKGLNAEGVKALLETSTISPETNTIFLEESEVEGEDFAKGAGPDEEKVTLRRDTTNDFVRDLAGDLYRLKRCPPLFSVYPIKSQADLERLLLTSSNKGTPSL